MSIHFSRYALNTYYGSPYFQSQIPPDYPTSLVLQKSRAFKRLPPNLRELAALSKKWAEINAPKTVEFVNQAYDKDGNELNIFTGEPMSDSEIDKQWVDNDELDDFKVEDIPLPPGGFADPDTWEEPKPPEDEADYEGPDREQVLLDIRSRGREYTSKYYGVEAGEMDDDELAEVILNKIGAP